MRKAILIALVALLAASVLLVPLNASRVAAQAQKFKKYVGYADSIVFKVITSMDEQVMALEKGEIDLIGDMVDPEFLPQLLGNPDIEVAYTDRLGFGLWGGLYLLGWLFFFLLFSWRFYFNHNLISRNFDLNLLGVDTEFGDGNCLINLLQTTNINNNLFWQVSW